MRINRSTQTSYKKLYGGVAFVLLSGCSHHGAHHPTIAKKGGAGGAGGRPQKSVLKSSGFTMSGKHNVKQSSGFTLVGKTIEKNIAFLSASGTKA